MAPQTGNNYISGTLMMGSKFQRQIRDFRWCRARQKISQMIATTTDDARNCNIGAQNVYIAVSGCRSSSQISQSPGWVSSLWAWSKTLDLQSEFQWYLSYSRRYKYFRFGWPQIVISRYPSMSHLLVDTFFILAWSITLFTALELQFYLLQIYSTVWLCDYDCVLDDDILLLSGLSVILKMYKYRCLHSCLVNLPSSVCNNSKNITSVKFMS